MSVVENNVSEGQKTKFQVGIVLSQGVQTLLNSQWESKMVFEQYSGVSKVCFKINLTGFTGADKRKKMRE